MPGIEQFIASHEKLIAACGSWPSFHDAKVIELHFSRGDVQPDEDRWVVPVLTMKLMLLPQSHDGRFVLATLGFDAIDEQFKMEGFNHVNEIVSFDVTTQPRGTYPSGKDMPPSLLVQLKPGFGMRASFRCARIEIVDATPCTKDGKLYAS